MRPGNELAQSSAHGSVTFAAFAHLPCDARTACIAVVEVAGSAATAVADCRDLGAPIVFTCDEDGVEQWRQGADAPQRVGRRIARNDLDAFLAQQTDERTFLPLRVYQAKTQARISPQLALPFVDELLLPSVERAMGERLGAFVHQIFELIGARLGHRRLTPELSHELFRSAFWLVAGKILKDKAVAAFADLDFADVDEVFRKVRRHYGEAPVLAQQNPALRGALEAASARAGSLGFLGQVTTEALAYVYETALVTPAVREALGTHATPPYLVDYILGRLDPWIAEMHWKERRVLEPACGHGAFLVAAMRRLRELLPPELPGAFDAHTYLKERLEGIEADPVAREIARLSLTLGDIPNPDGWNLHGEDMFTAGTLERCAQAATIFLANPPFEDFTLEEKRRYARSSPTPLLGAKADEMLRRVLPNLPAGAVFGVIVPHGTLHNDNARALREGMLRDCELREVLVLPDKVFKFADVEAAVLIGRKRPPAIASAVRWRRVREPDIGRFRDAYEVTWDCRVSQSRFTKAKDSELWVPDLANLWERWTGKTLHEIADVGKGLEYHGKEQLKGAKTWSSTRFKGAVRGYRRVPRGLMLHGHPDEAWMSLTPEVISRPRWGTTVGRPQVLMNYAPVSRRLWRIKAVMDPVGHAVTSRFLVVRPTSPETPLEFLWALCNSPLANAYAYAHGTKRETNTGILREMPVPSCEPTDMARVARAVRKYVDAATAYEEAALKGPKDVENCHRLLLDVDALVLRLYDLPSPIERELLDLFVGQGDRLGVPGPWAPYLPEDLEPSVPLYIYRASAGKPRKRPRTRSEGDTDDVVLVSFEPEAGDDDGPYDPDQILPGPSDVEREIALLDEEIGDAAAFRAEYGSSSELDAFVAGRRARLRELQEKEARRISLAFRQRFSMPPEGGPDIIDRVARVLEEYGVAPPSDSALRAADPKKTSS